MRDTWAIAMAVAGAMLAWSGNAAAQVVAWTKDSSPLIIHAVEPPRGEQVARKGEPLLIQPMTSLRNVRLKATAPTLMAMSSTREYPAGSELYGIQAPDGWIYCAAARTWLTDPQTICYQDMDGDGAFDRVRDSGVPFGNVPLLAYAFGTHKVLPQPVPYEALPYRQGPSIGYVVRWAPVRDKKAGRDAPIYQIAWGASLKSGDRLFDLGNGPNIPLFTIGGRITDLQPMHVLGAVITPLGVTDDGSLRYRVDRAIPEQVLQIRMTMTVSTYYYVY